LGITATSCYDPLGALEDMGVRVGVVVGSPRLVIC